MTGLPALGDASQESEGAFESLDGSLRTGAGTEGRPTGGMKGKLTGWGPGTEFGGGLLAGPDTNTGGNCCTWQSGELRFSAQYSCVGSAEQMAPSAEVKMKNNALTHRCMQRPFTRPPGPLVLWLACNAGVRAL
jgi:hypothetical protein